MKELKDRKFVCVSIPAEEVLKVLLETGKILLEPREPLLQDARLIDFDASGALHINFLLESDNLPDSYRYYGFYKAAPWHRTQCPPQPKSP